MVHLKLELKSKEVFLFEDVDVMSVPVLSVYFQIKGCYHLVAYSHKEFENGKTVLITITKLALTLYTLVFLFHILDSL